MGHSLHSTQNRLKGSKEQHLDATQKILHKNRKMKIIILTALEKPEFLKQARKAGAHGYLMKSALPQEMIRAIQTVAQGGYHFQKQVTPLCSPLPSSSKAKQLAKLSPKEKEVFDLLFKGYTIASIAYMLKRQPRTIRTHRENILKKLGIDTDRALIIWATQKD